MVIDRCNTYYICLHAHAAYAHRQTTLIQFYNTILLLEWRLLMTNYFVHTYFAGIIPIFQNKKYSGVSLLVLLWSQSTCRLRIVL